MEIAKEVWGTFSVKDHCQPNAFIAEVMLYDRLVIPVPPDEKEKARWEAGVNGESWQPELQSKLLSILGDRARPIPWDEQRRQNWRTRYEAGMDIAHLTNERAFTATRNELIWGLPKYVTGIATVTNYPSIEEFDKNLNLVKNEGTQEIYGGAALAIMGHEFFIPNDYRWSHEDLLRKAVELSSEDAFRAKRAAFWNWQSKFMNSEGITDQDSIKTAVKEMRHLLKEEKAMVTRHNIQVGVNYAFLIGSIALSLLGGPLTPLGLGGAFLSIGDFAVDKYFESKNDKSYKPVALVHDIQKHFGWM